MGPSAGPESMRSWSLRRGIAWLPPFLVAFAGAAAGEMSAGLLLYSTEGFLRALTVVLVAEMAALGLGFLVSSPVEETDFAALRRRWLLAVFSFAAAAVFAGIWGLSDGAVGGDLDPRIGRGLGLGFLAALPLFSTGSVLGTITATSVPASLGGDGTGAPADVAAPAFFGAAAGLLFTGLYGVPTLQPASLYLICVVAVSGGALLHGWMTDRRMRILPLDGSKPGRSSVSGREILRERRVRTTPPGEIQVLYVDGRMADAGAVPSSSTGRADAGSGTGGWDPGEGAGWSPAMRTCLPWQRHVLDVVRDEARPEESRLRILMIGVGTGALLSGLASRGHGEIVALELEDSWAGHSTGPSGSAPDRASVGTGADTTVTVVDHWDAVSTLASPRGFDVLVVHLRLVPRNGPFRRIDLEFIERALSLRSPGGIALLGGIDLDDDVVTGRTLDWLSSRCGAPASLFRPRAGTWAWEAEPWDDLVGSLEDLGGGLVACRPTEARGEGPTVGSGPFGEPSK